MLPRALLLDGAKGLREVLGQWKALSQDFAAPLDVVAVGQKGTLLALELLCERPGEKMPRGKLSKARTGRFSSFFHCFFIRFHRISYDFNAF